MNALTIGALTIGTVLGVGVIPGWVYLLGKDIDLGSDIGGRIMFTIAQLITGGGVLDYQADGNYVYRRLTTPQEFTWRELAEHDLLDDHGDVDCEYVLVHADGGLEAFDSNTHIGRLGKEPFAVTYDSTDPEMFRDIQHTEREIMARNNQTVVYNDTRGGMHVFRDYYDDLAARVLVSVRKLDQQLQDAGVPVIADRQKERAIQEYGGDTSDINTKWLLIAGLASTMCGALIAYMVV